MCSSIWVCRSPDEDILKPSTPTAAINRLIPLWTFISPFFLPAVLACRPFSYFFLISVRKNRFRFQVIQTQSDTAGQLSQYNLITIIIAPHFCNNNRSHTGISIEASIGDIAISDPNDWAGAKQHSIAVKFEDKEGAGIPGSAWCLPGSV